MKIIFRDDGMGLVRVNYNGVDVDFSYEHSLGKWRLTEKAALRAADIGILCRLEDTLNGSTDYIDEVKESKSEEYNEMLKARDILNRWLEANK
jgi:hypothetical protein